METENQPLDFVCFVSISRYQTKIQLQKFPTRPFWTAALFFRSVQCSARHVLNGRKVKWHVQVPSLGCVAVPRPSVCSHRNSVLPWETKYIHVFLYFCHCLGGIRLDGICLYLQGLGMYTYSLVTLVIYVLIWTLICWYGNSAEQTSLAWFHCLLYDFIQ